MEPNAHLNRKAEEAGDRGEAIRVKMNVSETKRSKKELNSKSQALRLSNHWRKQERLFCAELASIQQCA